MLILDGSYKGYLEDRMLTLPCQGTLTWIRGAAWGGDSKGSKGGWMCMLVMVLHMQVDRVEEATYNIWHNGG